MSNGKTHESINNAFILLVFLTPFLILSVTFTDWLSSQIPLVILYGAIFGYWFGTYYLNPDLDIKSRPYNRWGVIRFIWIPYQKIFKHRSPFTHFPILSDAIRIIYLFAIIVLILGLFNQIFKIIEWDSFLLHIKNVNSISNTLFLGVFVGSSTSTFVHFVTDLLSTKKKKSMSIHKRKKAS